MMKNEYKGLINQTIINSYSEVLVIDIMDDKLYKYLVVNNSISFDKEYSYMQYLSDCKDFIYEDDIDNYVESLSILKLEGSKDGIKLSYKKKDDKLGSFRKYMNFAKLFEVDGKKIIVVLVSNDKDDDVCATKSEDVKTNLEAKLNKMVDAVSLAILKIHNIINNDGNIYSIE